jgi:hypothetical protein
MFLCCRIDSIKEIDNSPRSSESLGANRESWSKDTDRFGYIAWQSVRKSVPDATSSRSKLVVVFTHALQQMYKVKKYSHHDNQVRQTLNTNR